MSRSSCAYKSRPRSASCSGRTGLPGKQKKRRSFNATVVFFRYIRVYTYRRGTTSFSFPRLLERYWTSGGRAHETTWQTDSNLSRSNDIVPLQTVDNREINATRGEQLFSFLSTRAFSPLRVARVENWKRKGIGNRSYRTYADLYLLSNLIRLFSYRTGCKILIFNLKVGYSEVNFETKFLKFPSHAALIRRGRIS